MLFFKTLTALKYFSTAPHGLGDGCMDVVGQSSCNWYNYVMSIPAASSAGLSYDIIPMLYPQLFEPIAKYGPLGFIGHEIILSTDDSSSSVYVGLNKHKQRYVPCE